LGGGAGGGAGDAADGVAEGEEVVGYGAALVVLGGGDVDIRSGTRVGKGRVT